MAFDDDVLEGRQSRSDGGVIRKRNGAGIKKTSAIVKLQVSGGGRRMREALIQFGQGMINLCGNGSAGNFFRESIFPKITVQTAPPAFAVGQKNSGDWNKSSGGGPLDLLEEREWMEGIDHVSARTLGGDPFGSDGAFIGGKEIQLA